MRLAFVLGRVCFAAFRREMPRFRQKNTEALGQRFPPLRVDVSTAFGSEIRPFGRAFRPSGKQFRKQAQT